ncbi:DUF4189 domain-containing protein [Achromobacter sp. UMC71]|uniref:DUF4189 domain-containing protein n=1 Tax=Achromobacter sp. UMC71 TaxID=1862320 RepID=UPI001601D11A|nr:DUF4189 domain-containing protein [Achromobacter sp. UMC71]MBB1627006.1 hypothetical protein [Achromobacter sp. UMC71]
MKMLRHLVMALATLTATVALMPAAVAEQGCPDGYTMAPLGTARCVPIPGLYQVPGGTQEAAPAPPRWKEQWGAIAVDSATGKTGVAGSKANRQQAEDAAMAICAKKGGGDCRVRLSYGNQCGVITWGNGTFVARSAGTLEAASERALNECRQESGGACEVFFSDCSLPVRIQ